MKLGVRTYICKSVLIQDGIQAVRGMLPRVWFDRNNCFTLVEALKLYRAEYNDERRAFNKQPIHDWTSHFADAMRYLALSEELATNDQWGAPIDYGMLDRAAI